MTDNPLYFRKVIKIKATDSPNVKYALAQKEKGYEPTNEIVVPGVLTWGEYRHRRATWDKIRQSIGLDAEFYEGSEILLFPADWLNQAEERARHLPRHRKAKGGGCDPAEGGDKTAMAAVDEYGLIELVSRKTPNTNDVVHEAIAFLHRHEIPPERFCFDRGGGGKQHADRLREMRGVGHPENGYPVRTVGFGESIAQEIKRGTAPVKYRREVVEERYEFKNRRAQMYGELSELLDPGLPGTRFAIPAEYHELRRQLAPIPKKYDNESRMFMLPKQNPAKPDDPNTLINLIGCSPDEADALVLAVHGMLHRGINRSAGVL